MGILHRVFARNAARVWETETRLMRRLGLVRPPSAVQWISTSVCDLHCPHCYSHAGRRSDGELSLDEAKTLIVDELVKLGRPQLVVAGGEALLRDDFEEFIRYVHSHHIPWSLHSHGGRVDRFRELFADCPPEMAAISIDGPREFHDRFRGREGAFDRALTAIKVLKETGCREVVVGTTITRENADLLVDLFPTVLTCGADSWGLHLFAPEGRGAEHRSLLPRTDQLRRVAAFARRKRRVFHMEMDNEWGSAGQDDPFYRDSPFLCGAGRFTCVVSATGEVMPCTTTDPAESEGNVRDRPLSRIWAEGFKRFRSAGHGVCSDGSDCWLQTRNGNSCKHAAFFSHDDPFSTTESERELVQIT